MMETQWLADRTMLRTLLCTHAHWTLQEYADAIGRSRGWVKKWVKRLRLASPDDASVLHNQSRARHHLPPRLSPAVIDRILDIRDHPPDNLHRTPGPKTILYYLHHRSPQLALNLRLPCSTRTIWRILREHGRIVPPAERQRKPIERPTPLTVWQLDFKDASTVPAEPEGKRQHVVEVLNTIDAGSSLLLNAQARDDFTAETTLQAVAETLRAQGLPQKVTVDRDPRFVGGTRRRDCPSAFERFCLCLGVEVTVLPPRRPDLNCFVERYHRTFTEECLSIFRPGDLAQVRDVTDHFRRHYNEERPHQGLACGNRPPQEALTFRWPNLPRRPTVPVIVDPDRWVVALDGRRYVRHVGKDARVSIDAVSYYLRRELVGQEVSMRVDAHAREFVVEHHDREVQRLPIKGLGHPPLPFDAFVAVMCEEARSDHYQRQYVVRQLHLPL